MRGIISREEGALGISEGYTKDIALISRVNKYVCFKVLSVETDENGEKYCLVLAQNIPAETIVNATVVVTIGSSPTTYPLLNCNCTNVSPAQLTTRTRYSTRVYTNIQSGVFKLLGPTKCNYCREYTGSLPITT